MRRIWSTKTKPEREDEESERLVRPAPKQKPPRHDRRRNRVDPDKDTDPDKDSDPDLSKNYKTIGGSACAVARRYIEARTVARVTYRYLMARGGERIPARSKETGKVVSISPKTLEEESGKYEPIEDEEETSVPNEPAQDEPKEGEGGSKEKPKGELSDAQRRHVEQEIEEAEKNWQAWDDWNTRQDIEDKMGPNDIEAAIEAAIDRADSYEPDEGGEEDTVGKVTIPGVGNFTPDELREILDSKKPEGSEPEDDPTGYTVEEWVEDFYPDGNVPTEKSELEPDEVSDNEPNEGGESDESDEDEPDEGGTLGEEDKGQEDKGQDDERKALADLVEKIKQSPEVPDLPDMEGDLVDTTSDDFKKFVENLGAVYDSLKGIVSEFASLLPNNPITEAVGTQVGVIERVVKDYSDGKVKKVEEAQEKLREAKDAEKKLKAELAKGETELSKKLDELQRDLDKPDSDKPVAKQLKIKSPARPPVQRAEVEEALHQATDAFGEAGARRLLERGYHPQDLKSLVSTFESGRIKVKNVRQYVEKIDYFEVNPDRVKPPKTWEKGGHEVPFDELSDSEKAEAYRQHQMQVVGLSLAAQSNIAVKVMGAGIPEEVSEAVARMALSSRSPEQAESLGRQLFEAAMESGRVPPVKRQIAKTMDALKGTGGATALAGFVQAADYYEAREGLFEGPDAISERDSASAIAKRLSKLSEDMEDRRLSTYPSSPNYGAATMLRTQVLAKLRDLDSEKYDEVRKTLVELDAKAYENAQESWEEEHTDWEARKEKHEQKRRGGGYRDQPLEEFDEPEPQPPPKPVGYDSWAGKGGELSEKVRERTALRVAACFISTYPPFQSMGNPHDKQGVYHGQEPGSVDPYPEWAQANPQDLEDEEKVLLTSVLRQARQWLGEGVSQDLPRDGKLRAALDYAIEEHGLRRVVDPTLYYKLLARLAGENPEEYGGETLTATASQGASDMSGTKLATADIPVIEESLTRLDKMAAWVQSNYQDWGLDFEVAKTLVQGLDKVADRVEKVAFGEASMVRRQAEVMGLKAAKEEDEDDDDDKGDDKTAAVEQQDPDEPYMSAYDNTVGVIQTESDEPYMTQFSDDQSSAVGEGIDSSGRPLAPHYG